MFRKIETTPCGKSSYSHSFLIHTECRRCWNSKWSLASKEVYSEQIKNDSTIGKWIWQIIKSGIACLMKNATAAIYPSLLKIDPWYVGEDSFSIWEHFLMDREFRMTISLDNLLTLRYYRKKIFNKGLQHISLRCNMR